MWTSQARIFWVKGLIDKHHDEASRKGLESFHLADMIRFHLIWAAFIVSNP